MTAHWQISSLSDQQNAACRLLTRELRISEASARLLAARGITTGDEARAFVRPSLKALHDPFLMQDMEQAVERLRRAIAKRERIMVYGDYDVDGTTAVALMYTFLRTQTDNLIYYIPDRYKEGYGISFQGIDTAEAEGCTLIVALDCGIKAVDKVDYAAERHIDFIVCDHHTPGDELPRAVAVLNMKRADCGYPFKELSGCGVGFKLVQAYALRAGIAMEEIYPLLPLTAMAIASDIVPVTGENRVLAFYGLRQMNAHPSVGIRAIMQVAGIGEKGINISDLVFKIGPRINACGRIHSGKAAVELLITDDEAFARCRAEEVNTYNTERKDYDTRTTEEALAMLRQDPDNEQKHTTVVYSPAWHKGVVGIAASRLTETYYRPTIVLTAGENGIISGSARSVSTFDIYSAIDSCRDLLTNFGGHKFAAGLSMQERDLPEFKRRFEEYVAAHITAEQMQPVVRVEAEIALEDITPQFFNILSCLEPFGPGNPRPVFLTRGLINNHGTRRVGKAGEHLRLDITDRTAAITGIAFGQGDKALHLQNGGSADMCYHIEPNTYNGSTTIQMVVVDMHTT
ncbi:MAG: single-stranded-DNA-specific exonuclease RecJ [Paludibacteraceae bacterium]